MGEELARAALFGVVPFDDVGPQHAGGAELGHLHEVVGGDAHRETDLAGRLVDGQPLVHQPHEVFVAGRKGEGQLLDDGRTGVRKVLARHRHHAHALHRGRTAHQTGQHLEALLPAGRAERAGERQTVDDRIEHEVHGSGLLPALLFDLRQYGFHDVRDAFARKDHFDGRQVDVAQQRLDLGGRQLLREREAQRIDARVEQFERLGVGRFGALDRQALVHAPHIVAPRTAHIGKFARFGGEEFETFEVFGAIVRPDVEPFGCPPHQFALVIGPFEVYRNHLFPLLGRNRREFGEQLFTLGICHNYFEIRFVFNNRSPLRTPFRPRHGGGNARANFTLS